MFYYLQDSKGLRLVEGDCWPGISRSAYHDISLNSAVPAGGSTRRLCILCQDIKHAVSGSEVPEQRFQIFQEGVKDACKAKRGLHVGGALY